MAIDFTARTVGPHPAPVTDGSVELWSFDQGGTQLPEYDIVPTALDLPGYHAAHRATCRLPGVCSQITLDFFTVGPATVTALDAGGAPVAPPVMAAVTGALETVNIVDPRIASFTIEAADNLDLLRLDWQLADKVKA